MRIAQLTGAYVNAGDFLIEKRSTALLQQFLPNAQITIYSRKDIERRFDEIDSNDVIIFTGGPLIKRDLNQSISVSRSMDFTKPIMMMGCGWAGEEGSKNGNYSYTFTPETLRFYKKVAEEGLGIGCRDLYTLRALRKDNVRNTYMTGCPAWYDLSHIGTLDIASGDKIENIYISDPAQPKNQRQALEIIRFIQKRFPSKRIKFVFHRNVDEAFKAAIEQNFPDIEVAIISGTAEGFEIYKNCDLHIGYRVHAHIYNLSIRNRSFLIEEDGRGAGVNEALGLIRITAYNDYIRLQPRQFPKVWKRKPVKTFNANVIEELDIALELMHYENSEYFRNAYRTMSMYFKQMQKFIMRIEAAERK